MLHSGLPHQAAWRHGPSREALEVAFLTPHHDGLLIDGRTVAVEDGAAWAVRYHIELDADWGTRHAVITTFAGTDGDERMTTLDHDGTGLWRVDGLPAHQLDGCLDVDFEASALTNAFPVRRATPAVGDELDAPAAYVRVAAVAPAKLAQTYRRQDDDPGGHASFVYASPAYDFTSTITYDAAGLVVTYPGIAERMV